MQEDVEVGNIFLQLRIGFHFSQLEDYPRPTSLSFEKLKEEEAEEGAVLYVPSSKGAVTVQAR